MPRDLFSAMNQHKFVKGLSQPPIGSESRNYLFFLFGHLFTVLHPCKANLAIIRPPLMYKELFIFPHSAEPLGC